MEQKNLDIYGSEPIPWSRALKQLEEVATKTSFWLATVRPDQRPHVAAVGALWVDGKFYFVSGAGTRKSRNLAGNPNCVISVGLGDLDLVVEGTATRVTDKPTLERLARLYSDQGWPASESDGSITAEYSAPAAPRGTCTPSRHRPLSESPRPSHTGRRAGASDSSSPAPRVLFIEMGAHGRKLGRFEEARAEFERAASLTENVRERELLQRRAAECAAERTVS